MMVLLVLQIVSAYPPLTPAAAADILRNGPGQSNAARLVYDLPREGPRPILVDAPHRIPAGPRRLDGTLLSQPVTVYGEYPWHSRHSHRAR